MPRLIPTLLAILSLSLAAPAAQPDWVRVEVPNYEPLELQEFGGPDVIIALRQNEASSFGITVADRGDLVPSYVADGYGGFDTVMVPRGTTRTFRKEKGIPVDGRLSEAYLVYEQRSTGLQVYFYDTLDSRQNHGVFLVVPAQAAEGAPPLPMSEAPPMAEEAQPSTTPLTADPAAPRTVPAWSLIGEVLLFGGRELTSDVRQAAARAGLSRDTYIEERTWVEKQRLHGRDDEVAEYESLFSERQARRAPSEQAAARSLRAALLSCQR